MKARKSGYFRKFSGKFFGGFWVLIRVLGLGELRQTGWLRNRNLAQGHPLVSHMWASVGQRCNPLILLRKSVAHILLLRGLPYYEKRAGAEGGIGPP